MESDADDATTSLLVDYDESLVHNRNYVPLPRDGFCDPDDTETRESERFLPLRTLPFVGCYSIALGIYFIVQTVYIIAAGGNKSQMILAASLHVPLLILAGIMEGFIRMAHRRRQSLGYLEFYRQTKKLLPIPFQTAAYSVAALFLLQSSTAEKGFDHQDVCIIAVCVLEGLVILVFDVLYIKRVLRHNRKEMSPDATKYLQSPLTDLPDTRRRRRDVVFDNQVEVIRYLQKQRNDLRAEIMRLRETMVTMHGTADAVVPTDDQKYLMASGEQRIRALKAEVDTLKRESEIARERCTERTEDAQRFQLLLDLQRKENQRLRETLTEWSRSNAKLEMKLKKAVEKDPVKSDGPSTSQATQ